MPEEKSEKLEEAKASLQMSEAALEKMKKLHPHIEEERIIRERRLEDLPGKQKEIFKAGVERLSQASEKEMLEEKARIKEQAEVIKGLNQEERLQELVNLAFNEDPVKASRISLELKDPYIEDKLHDILVEYHEELKKRGKLEEI